MAECFVISNDCYRKIIVWLGTPFTFLRGGGGRQAIFEKNYHFIEHAYICEFSIHKYSGESILSVESDKTEHGLIFNVHLFTQILW